MTNIMVSNITTLLLLSLLLIKNNIERFCGMQKYLLDVAPINNKCI